MEINLRYFMCYKHTIKVEGKFKTNDVVWNRVLDGEEPTWE